MSWTYEFGAEYEVPAEIAGSLPDQSWHNDACPSFGETVKGREDDHDIRLWVEHPDYDRRDTGSQHRYAVNYHPWGNEAVPGVPRADMGDEVYLGDDVEAALNAYHETLARVKAYVAED